MKDRRRLLWCIFGLLAYMLLVMLLAVSERGLPGAAIHGFWDALWYSLVTITTVGYGDMVPVSVIGRCVGFVFVLLSIGVWAALLSALAAILRGQLLPQLRLWRIRRQPWYVFSEYNGASRALAADLRKQGLEGSAVFCAAADKQEKGGVYVPQELFQSPG